jgi:2-polyprenyl-3-methyl-5-hydroxy-6-metoxy-1,4-benzoquinol methylase
MFDFIKNIFLEKLVISPITSTERETAVSLLEVKKENIFRYNLAREIIEKKFSTKNTQGLDLFCANGYGTYFIGKFLKNTFITGIDGSKAAIKIAKKHYKLNNISYIRNIFPFKLKKAKYDYVICFESIEHLTNGKLLLDNLYNSLKYEGILIISTTNNDILPLCKNPNKFHKLQYSYTDFKTIILKAGFEIEKIYGQNVFELNNNKEIQNFLPVKERIIKENTNCQYMIFYCKKPKNITQKY